MGASALIRQPNNQMIHRKFRDFRFLLGPGRRR